ncbi:tetrapyrrole methylase [Campylobacter sputorum subsp. bubulus]|uniref:Ribosomal RNA small subunit methyltransferase I n=1 Tax=Campylobacter sputorum subsp. sputorum TaxID=32024 RepID=A0A381DJ35_9BACT|nr:16S rRNA (cytidine(1402)-2'-O)-methyltransferase [Campylobacter sputorum]ASM35650.1 16S rRNA (cytidine(1402)-2'-O)-methyltransferase [Campylobacter sputorum aubsp. sputorum RM3237]ASM39033.1 16S rRNA (cytidine(1402)-2'-O)-methyltransferase [Campylobacter sputorum bv. paraureolyticus LMG 11764]KAB0582620.1 16S rRNA (cytidine(1402)-2'-O)-methyltransferase [Campylobacter sputorum subsp. sputorum]MDY6120337.1 16S rRNA (cytidine(1402)-2'-O)-methyltransferase [Campylobacter sputorum]QEL05842.1 16
MLYFVPTPIGNLDDISSHALDILKRCEILICEDTRVSKSLINLLNQKYQISISPDRFYSLHTHNSDEFFRNVNIDIFDKICVYVSDAGMPCISDPGIELVKFAQKNSIPYEVISGSNAALLAVAASGMVEKEWIFIGFLPNTSRNRIVALQNTLNLPYPSVIYESPQRIFSLIEDISKIDPNREIFAIKEATKKFETKFKGIAINLLNDLKNANLKGEWCIVVNGSDGITHSNITQDDILSLNIAPKIKAKLLSKITGENAKKIYEKIIK